MQLLYCIIYNDDKMYRVYDLKLRQFMSINRQSELYMNNTTSAKSDKRDKRVIFLYPFDYHKLKSYRYPKQVVNNSIPKYYRC